jgi:flagellar basal-body rod protein FlgC
MENVKNAFDIARRAMGSQMVRMNTIASNLANAETKSGSPDTAYRALRPVFETVYDRRVVETGRSSVDVREVVGLDREPERIYEPGHPLANAEGFVFRAAVDVDEEMVEMLEASRHYQNNLQVVTTLRALMERTVELGKR